MTYSEIYKILSFENKKLITTKLLCPQKNTLIIVTCSAKQHGGQIVDIGQKASHQTLKDDYGIYREVSIGLGD